MDAIAPNHHAHHPGFSGLGGTVAAVSMAAAHGDDARLAVELVDLHPDDQVVDIGCGPGNAVRRAARTAHATGIDPAPAMLRVARLFGSARGRATYAEGTAEDLPLPDGSATVVWALATVHHWQDLETSLAEIRRVLRPRGRYLAVERRTEPGATGLASHGWTVDQAEAYAQRCHAAGFASVQVSTHHAGRRDLVAVLATDR